MLRHNVWLMYLQDRSEELKLQVRMFSELFSDNHMIPVEPLVAQSDGSFWVHLDEVSDIFTNQFFH